MIRAITAAAVGAVLAMVVGGWLLVRWVEGPQAPRCTYAQQVLKQEIRDLQLDWPQPQCQ